MVLGVAEMLDLVSGCFRASGLFCGRFPAFFGKAAVRTIFGSWKGRALETL